MRFPSNLQHYPPGMFYNNTSNLRSNSLIFGLEHEENSKLKVINSTTNRHGKNDDGVYFRLIEDFEKKRPEKDRMRWGSTRKKSLIQVLKVNMDRYKSYF